MKGPERVRGIGHKRGDRFEISCPGSTEKGEVCERVPLPGLPEVTSVIFTLLRVQTQERTLRVWTHESSMTRRNEPTECLGSVTCHSLTFVLQGPVRIRRTTQRKESLSVVLGGSSFILDTKQDREDRGGEEEEMGYTTVSRSRGSKWRDYRELGETDRVTTENWSDFNDRLPRERQIRMGRVVRRCGIGLFYL